MTEQAAFDPSLYPRSYRLPLMTRIMAIVVGILLALGGPLAIWDSIAGQGVRGLGKTLGSATGGLAITGLGIVLFRNAVRFRLVLYADTIELRDVWSLRSMRRSDISRRYVKKDSGRYYRTYTLHLVSQWKDERDLSVPMDFATDAAFDAWMASIPDSGDPDR